MATTSKPDAQSVLAQAMQFTLLVESLLRSDSDGITDPASESEVAEAMYALRAALSKAVPAAQGDAS